MGIEYELGGGTVNKVCFRRVLAERTFYHEVGMNRIKGGKNIDINEGVDEHTIQPMHTQKKVAVILLLQKCSC
jgi:hypothetical protein